MMSGVDFTEVDALIDRHEADRAEAMPTEQDAVDQMFDAWARLRALGWSNPRCCLVGVVESDDGDDWLLRGPWMAPQRARMSVWRAATIAWLAGER